MASLHVNILLLGAMGLGALYFMHLLAQDYNKIRKPVQTKVNDHHDRLLLATSNNYNNQRDLLLISDIENGYNRHNNNKENTIEKINWNGILMYDPLNCALSLICQLASGAEKDNLEAIKINSMVEYSLIVGAPTYIQDSYSLGLKYSNDFGKCENHFIMCPYSAKTMLKLLWIYSKMFD